MATPRYNPTIPSVVPESVSGRNQPTGAFGDQGRFGVTTYRPLRVNPQPPPRITSSVDEDNTEIIREGNSLQSRNEEGISDQKPDIILVSEFKPIYNKQTISTQSIFSDTPAKKYFDTILETRRLKAENSFLEYDRIASSSPEIKSKFSKIFQQNANLVSFLKDKFASIVEIHADVEKFKGFLDPRNKKVYLDDELRRNFSRISTREDLEENIGGESVLVEAKDLLEEIGFKSQNFNFYSNTKVLAQIIQGYRMLCKNKDLILTGTQSDTSGMVLLETELQPSGSKPPAVDFNLLPKGRDNIFNFCYERSEHISWNKNWDTGSLTLLNSINNRVFSNYNNTNIFYDKLVNVINILSTEFSVCFNRMYSKNSSKYARQSQILNTPSFEKVPNGLLNSGSINPDSPYALLKSGSLLTLEPTSFVSCRNVLDTSSFDKIKTSVNDIKSTIVSFEDKFLDLSKSFGFVPAISRNDEYSQLFSSKSLFENIFYRFFDLEEKPKWDLNEMSSHVFSIVHNFTSVLGAGSQSGSNFTLGQYKGSSNTLKYSLFMLICSEIGNESEGTRKGRINILWDNLKSLFAELQTGGSPQFPVTKADFGNSFPKTPELRRFLDYKNSTSESESLYKIISTTLKEFNYVIENFCLDSETGRTNHRDFDKFFILLMIFEIILMVLLHGYEKYVSSFLNFEKFILEEKKIPFSVDKIRNDLQSHDIKVRKFFCFISGYARQTREEIEKIQRKIDNPALKDFLSDMNDLNQQISSKQQSSIALNSLLDLQPLFNNPEMRTESNLPSYKFVNSSIMGEKTKSAFFSLMKNDKFLNEGRIISIGIPNGFFDQILYKDKNRVSSWSYSQKDIVKLKIYKIELTRPDLVFLPVIKEFELSRLIARDDSYLLFDGRGGYNVSLGKFPTRDFDNPGDRLAIQYYLENSDGFSALTDPSYSNIALTDKIKIYQNHVESYLLEIYTRIMSGISLAEGNISDFSGITPQNLQSNLKKILSDPGIVLENFESFDRVDPNNPSTLSSTEQIALNVLSPKPYDRVLNVLVRSDDFIIDFNKTTESGRDNFLNTDTDIERISPTGPTFYRLKPREFSFETYFVTIEIDESRGAI